MIYKFEDIQTVIYHRNTGVTRNIMKKREQKLSNKSGKKIKVI